MNKQQSFEATRLEKQRSEAVVVERNVEQPSSKPAAGMKWSAWSVALELATSCCARRGCAPSRISRSAVLALASIPAKFWP